MGRRRRGVKRLASRSFLFCDRRAASSSHYLPAQRFGDTTGLGETGWASLVGSEKGGRNAPHSGVRRDGSVTATRRESDVQNVTSYARERIVSLRVLPASRGAWRVEDQAGTRASCATLAEAEALAERLLRELGGGQMMVYDAYLRLRAVKRLAV